jgi:hypothetical protein
MQIGPQLRASRPVIGESDYRALQGRCAWQSSLRPCLQRPPPEPGYTRTTMTNTRTKHRRGVASASAVDTLAVLADVAAPTLAKGIIIRRPKIVSIAERLNLTGRAVARLQVLRRKYGTGPIVLGIPAVHQAIILDPEDVARVLEGAPEPFSPASKLKKTALAHFEPNVSLISNSPERGQRRRFNEAVLEHECRVHSLSGSFMRIIDEEVADLLGTISNELTWDAFFRSWYRIVRRVVLGDTARNDDELTDMLGKLRTAANWAFLRPRYRKLNRQFHRRVDRYLARAEESSLAGTVGPQHLRPGTDASSQFAHYLFAFDPGGMATYRTLALLCAHPEQERRVREEITTGTIVGRKDLAFTRSCFLECLRLYPTTPAILRETTEDVEWKGGGTLPKGTQLVIFTPFFHRDDENDPDAHRFTPERWLNKAPTSRLPLVPFSAGPGVCPAGHLVPMVGSATIAAILANRKLVLRQGGRVSPETPLPTTLDHYSMAFAVSGMMP